MADRFGVVAVRIKYEGPVVVRVVLGAKPGTTVVAPARHDGFLVERVYGGAVVGGKRDVEGLAWLALDDPEVRLARAPESRRVDAGFHDQIVAKRGEGFFVEALASFEIRYGNTYVIRHCSHSRGPWDRTDIRQAEYPREGSLRNGDLRS